MNIDTYQEMSKRTMPTPSNYRDENDRKVYYYDELDKSNYAMGLAGEAGEVVDLIKKEVHHGHEQDLEKVKNELGDVMHYVSGIATMYGFQMSDILKYNLRKLATRYPDGFSTENSIKRVDVDGLDE